MGVIVLIVSGILCYACVVSPLLDASRHEQQVSLLFKGVVILPSVLTYGLLHIALGQEAYRIFGTPQSPKLSAAGWVVLIITFAIGLLAYVLLQGAIESYGYQF